MSANKYHQHIVVLIEDDANRQILNGFLGELQGNSRAIVPMPLSGGWARVRDDFRDNELAGMRNNPRRNIVMLVDFDEREDRYSEVLKFVPEDLKDRVFVLGSFSDPQGLKRAILGDFETIGRSLARDCRDNTTVTWSNELLKHNAQELERMMPVLRTILFPVE